MSKSFRGSGGFSGVPDTGSAIFKEAHRDSDVDFEASSLHHTLGYGQNQAAPGAAIAGILKRVGLAEAAVGTIAGLSSTVSGLSSTVGGHQSAITSLQTTVGNHATTIASHTGTINSHTTSINSHTTSINTINTNYTTVNNKVTALQTLTGSHTTTLGNLNTTVNGHTTTLGSHNTSITALNTNMYNAVWSINDLLARTAPGGWVNITGMPAGVGTIAGWPARYRRLGTYATEINATIAVNLPSTMGLVLFSLPGTHRPIYTSSVWVVWHSAVHGDIPCHLRVYSDGRVRIEGFHNNLNPNNSEWISINVTVPID